MKLLYATFFRLPY